MSNASTVGSKPAPMYRRHDSQAECYSKATVPAMPAVKRTPASPFIPVKITTPPIPREEED